MSNKDNRFNGKATETMRLLVVLLLFPIAYAIYREPRQREPEEWAELNEIVQAVDRLEIHWNTECDDFMGGCLLVRNRGIQTETTEAVRAMGQFFKAKMRDFTAPPGPGVHSVPMSTKGNPCEVEQAITDMLMKRAPLGPEPRGDGDENE